MIMTMDVAALITEYQQTFKQRSMLNRCVMSACVEGESYHEHPTRIKSIESSTKNTRDPV
jgi:hypothetical protein